MARVKSAKQEKLELLDKVIASLTNEKNGLDSKKHWFTRQSKIEQQKEELQKQIDVLTDMKNKLAAKTRGIKKVKRGVISGYIVDRKIYKVVGKREDKITDITATKASITARKNTLATSVGPNAYGIKRLEKIEKKLDNKIKRINNRKVRAEGYARTILLPKLTRENHLAMQTARQQGVYDFRKGRYDSMNTVADAYRDLGTIRGAIKAAAVSIGGSIYKKRVDHAQKWLQKLQAKAPVYKGSKGLLRAKAMGMIGRHL